ncbi:MAG: nucleotidyltransferase family protein [Betaproteobacteria bacterium]|nr:nucleotidyltransferase family protein [Betaproteobacteria bacterium]MDH3438241.1 nucleotidyltransferase family protein [Betaproteobacteria bacterium]
MAESPKHIVAILLAAGSGSRFGGEKLLHPLPDAVAIAAHAARNLLAVAPEVVAVVRWGDFPLYDLLEQEGCRVTDFQGAAQGMGASLAHGVAQARDADGWVVALADMPSIRPETIRSIIAALEGGALIAAPTYDGKRGHPVGFGAPLRHELLALGGDQGARAVIERHRDEVTLVECNDPGTLIDIDRRDDLARLNGPGASR